jgi:uncharacterized membrane protein YcaP (DUF421 family)
MQFEDFIQLLIRISVMYLYVLALVRISGKRSFGNLSAMDLVITSAVGDSFDNVIYGDIEITPGLVGLGTLVLLHILVAFAASRSQRIYRLVNSPARLIIQEGQLLPKNLARERTRAETVLSELRLVKEEHLKEIKEARWEPEGQISVLKTHESKPVKKKEAHQLQQQR